MDGADGGDRRGQRLPVRQGDALEPAADRDQHAAEAVAGSAVGNAVVALLSHPDQLELVRSDPSLYPAAIEELLRYESPVERALNRWAAKLGTHYKLFMHDWSELGMDRLLRFSASDTLSFWAGGTDVTSTGVAFNLATTAAQNTRQGSTSATGFENLSGSRYGDALTGNTQDNILAGLEGADSLLGRAGNDSLVGGAGNEYLQGRGDGDVLTNAINQVSMAQERSADLTGAFLRGENVEIHQVMAASEEAGLSLEMMVEVRNKFAEAYRTLINMQS